MAAASVVSRAIGKAPGAVLTPAQFVQLVDQSSGDRHRERGSDPSEGELLSILVFTAPSERS